MKYLVFLTSLMFHIQANCQKSDELDSNKMELTILTGYNNSLGFLGGKIGYTPSILNSRLQGHAGLGFDLVQGVLVSSGLNFFVTRKRYIEPFIGFDFVYGLKNSLISENQSDASFFIGSHLYLNPYLAARINVKSPDLSLKLKFGYSNLISPMKLEVAGGPNNSGTGSIEKRIQSGIMFSIGVSSQF